MSGRKTHACDWVYDDQSSNVSPQYSLKILIS
jgi:hypothetical protein